MNILCRLCRLFGSVDRAGALFLVAIVLFITLQSTAPMAQGLNSQFSLSPDGRVVAFHAGPKGVGMYDWRTGQTRYVPVPSGFMKLTWASYSADSGKLAVVAVLPPNNPRDVVHDTRLGIIDLITNEMQSFAVSEKIIFSPVLRPDGKALLFFSAYRGPDRPFLLDLKSQTSRELLSKQDGFAEISRPSFVSNDTIFFAARGPKNPDLQALVRSLGFNPVTGVVPYLLKIGSTPQIAYLDAFDKYMNGLSRSLPGLPEAMAASRNGERIAFLGLSQSSSARESFRSGGLARYDVFAIEAGQVRQVTHLENYLARFALSHDGSTAAFGLYPKPLSEEVRRLGRGGIPLELAIVDLNTGQVTRTDFVRHALNAPN